MKMYFFTKISTAINMSLQFYYFVVLDKLSNWKHAGTVLKV